MRLTVLPGRAFRLLKRLARDDRANSLIEFTLAAPIALYFGAFAIEAARRGMVQMKLSQIALNLADNVSRTGLTSSMGITQFRESDVVEAFNAARLQGEGIELTQRGRIILSSLQRDATGNFIAWQRCVGRKNATSTYGTPGTTASARAPVLTGIGPAGQKVNPSGTDSAVMFVELTYDLPRLFLETRFFGDSSIRYTAAFLVRDRRDLTGGTSGIFPVTGVTAMTCNQFTT
jgi:Flp pilus assembly protein TadG